MCFVATVTKQIHAAIDSSWKVEAAHISLPGLSINGHSSSNQNLLQYQSTKNFGNSPVDVIKRHEGNMDAFHHEGGNLHTSVFKSSYKEWAKTEW